MKIDPEKILKQLLKANEAARIIKILPGPIIVGTAVGAIIGGITMLARRKG